MSEWQPIEIAPKDGTPILAACIECRIARIIEWDRSCLWLSEPGWVDVWNNDSDIEPIVWMPLPNVPEQTFG